MTALQHWTNPVVRNRDIERQAELEALGWRIVRVELPTCCGTGRAIIVVRTAAALRAAGADIAPT